MMRFFRCESGDEFYDGVRATLDNAWGLPSAQTKTETCIPPAASAIRDAEGRILLAVMAEFCDFSVAVDLLPELLGSGAITAISGEAYNAALPNHYG